MDWQPIATAPEDGRSVMLWKILHDVDYGHAVIGRWNDDMWWDEAGEYTFRYVTHWMPLPAPPVQP